MALILVFSVLTIAVFVNGFYEATHLPSPIKISNKFTERIVDGQDATRNQFPYQVSLQLKHGLGFRHICGGSIISLDWILTAAHCLNMKDYNQLQVVAGILLLSDTDIDGQQIKRVQQIIKHPLYSIDNVAAPYDIALVRLDSRLQYSVNVQSIFIPQQGHVSRGDGYLSGWGHLASGGHTPDHLQFAKLPIIPEQECQDKFDEILPNRHSFSIALNLCSGIIKQHESACEGDSGGPFVQDGRVIGVVSWGVVPCGDEGAPTVYSKTSAFANWITNSTNGEVRPVN